MDIWSTLCLVVYLFLSFDYYIDYQGGTDSLHVWGFHSSIGMSPLRIADWLSFGHLPVEMCVFYLLIHKNSFYTLWHLVAEVFHSLPMILNFIYSMFGIYGTFYILHSQYYFLPFLLCSEIPTYLLVLDCDCCFLCCLITPWNLFWCNLPRRDIIAFQIVTFLKIGIKYAFFPFLSRFEMVPFKSTKFLCLNSVSISCQYHGSVCSYVVPTVLINDVCAF